MSQYLRQVLVVEPEEQFFQFLLDILESEGYAVKHRANALSILSDVDDLKPHLVVFNQTLPNLISADVVKQIRQEYTRLPLLMIVDSLNKRQIVRDFQLGLNDFIVRPFSAEDFLTRIELLLLSPRLSQGRKLVIGDLSYDLDTVKVKRGKRTIALTPREKALLRYLMRNKNRVLSREVILSRVWRYPSDVDSRAVDVYVGYLRQKIDSGHSQKLIHTVRGFGYMISDQ